MGAEPDFYLPGAGIFVEVKGQMTLHQVSKMLYLAANHHYYVYQHSEVDWDPTLGSFIDVSTSLPSSTQIAKRKAFNRSHQQRELCYLASNRALAARVGAVTANRLRAYVQFFNKHVCHAVGRGLL